ncbi:MAG: hypothetical protein AAB377_00495 [Patescibacteria group bacterium]
MMSLRWWVIVIAIAAIFMIYRIIKGMWIAHCSRMILKGKKTNEKVSEPELEFEETSKDGDGDNG